MGKQPDHSEIMFALGALHSDVKNLVSDVGELKVGSTSRMDGHSRRIGSLETSRTRLVSYAAGMSAGVFTLGTWITKQF